MNSAFSRPWLAAACMATAAAIFPLNAGAEIVRLVPNANLAYDASPTLPAGDPAKIHQTLLAPGKFAFEFKGELYLQDAILLEKCVAGKLTVLLEFSLSKEAIDYPVIYRNELYFRHRSPAGIYQLARFDGDHLTLFANPDADGSSGGSPIVFQDKLYFSYGTQRQTQALGVFDGSHISVIPGGYSTEGACLFANRLYLTLTDPFAQDHLVAYDGVAARIVPHTFGLHEGNTPIIDHDRMLVARRDDNNPFTPYWAWYDGHTLSPIQSPAADGSFSFPTRWHEKLYVRYADRNLNAQWRVCDGTNFLPVPGPDGQPSRITNAKPIIYRDQIYLGLIGPPAGAPRLVAFDGQTMTPVDNFVFAADTPVTAKAEHLYLGNGIVYHDKFYFSYRFSLGEIVPAYTSPLYLACFDGSQVTLIQGPCIENGGTPYGADPNKLRSLVSIAEQNKHIQFDRVPYMAESPVVVGDDLYLRFSALYGKPFAADPDGWFTAYAPTLAILDEKPDHYPAQPPPMELVTHASITQTNGKFSVTFTVNGKTQTLPLQRPRNPDGTIPDYYALFDQQAGRNDWLAVDSAAGLVRHIGVVAAENPPLSGHYFVTEVLVELPLPTWEVNTAKWLGLEPDYAAQRLHGEQADWILYTDRRARGGYAGAISTPVMAVAPPPPVGAAPAPIPTKPAPPTPVTPSPVTLPSSTTGLPASMTETETAKGAPTRRATWTFAKSQGQSQWNDGSRATLTIEKFETGTLVIYRADSAQTAPGLTGRYTGKITGTHVDGTVEWTWPARWGSLVVTGTWTAEITATQN